MPATKTLTNSSPAATFFIALTSEYIDFAHSRLEESQESAVIAERHEQLNMSTLISFVVITDNKKG